METMMLRMTNIAMIALLTMGSGAMAAKEQPPRLSEKQAARLAKALDGKVAGPPVSCISRILNTNGFETISDEVLLYKVNKDLTYRNDLNGRCSGISNGSTTMVLKPTADQYCRGDIVNTVDLTIGMRGGSCGLGSFVPYRTPK
jgi:hypothetical protein